MSNLVTARRGVSGDERGGGDDLSGRAEAALHRVCAREGRDERMVAQRLDRRHLARADRVRERDARQRRHALELNRARSAVTLVAGDLRAGEAEILAQHLSERTPEGDVER